jgi:hypothetical protein
MQVYEIRVLDDRGKTTLIASEVRLSDSAAIRSAKALSGKSNFEVWRGMDCIYEIDPVPRRTTPIRLDLSPP